MKNPQTIGVALGLFGTVLMWQSGMIFADYFQTAGTRDIERLLFNPDYSLRMLSALAAFTAGLAALTERKGGAWLAGISSFLLLVKAFALLGGHGSVEEWQTEAVFLIVSTCLFLAFVVFNGSKSPETDKLST